MPRPRLVEQPPNSFTEAAEREGWSESWPDLRATLERRFAVTKLSTFSDEQGIWGIAANSKRYPYAPVRVREHRTPIRAALADLMALLGQARAKQLNEKRQARGD